MRKDKTMRHAGEVSICGKNRAYWCQILIGCLVFPVVSVTQSLASNERKNQDPIPTHDSVERDPTPGEDVTNPDPLQEIARLNRLADRCSKQGRYGEAESLYRKAIGISESTFGQNSETAGLLNNLALILRSQAKYQEAESIYRKALQINQNLLGAKHVKVATILHNLGEACRYQGKFAGGARSIGGSLEDSRSQLRCRSPRPSLEFQQSGSALSR